MNNINYYESRKDLIGKRIKEARKYRGYTQTELAENLFCERTAIIAWETGKRLPTLDNLFKMCDLFDCEMGYLFCDYSCKKKETTDVQKVMGLSEKAIVSFQNEYDGNEKKSLNKLFETLQGQQALHNMAAYFALIPTGEIIDTNLVIDEDTTLALSDSMILDYVLNTITSNIKAVRTGVDPEPIYKNVNFKANFTATFKSAVKGTTIKE